MALTGWYKTSSFVNPLDGEAVALWTDSSGNGRTLSQGTSGFRPRIILDQLNGKPSVRFDGVDDYLLSAVNLSAFFGAFGIGTVIALVRFEKYLAPDAAGHGIWGINLSLIGGGGTKLSLRFDSVSIPPGPIEAGNRDAGGIDYVTITPPSGIAITDFNPYFDVGLATQPFIVTWIHSPTAVLGVGVNNLDTAALQGVASGASTNLAAFLLFGRSFEHYWRGDIFDVRFYNTALTEEERRAAVLSLTEEYALPYESGIASVPTVESAPVKVELRLPTTELQLTGAGGGGESASAGEISPPALRLKASAITGLNDGDPVSTWPDSSGNGHDVTAAGTARPLYKTNILNGKPVVRFDGINDLLVSSDNLNKILGYDGRGIIYAVIFANDGVRIKTHPIIASASGDVHMVVLETTLTDNVRVQNDDGTLDSVNYSYTRDTWAIATWMHSINGGGNDEVPDQLDVTVNTKFGANVASGVTAFAELNNTFQIGGDGADFLEGDIAEILVFTKPHNGNTREHVHSYLKEEYNITASIPATPEPWWIDVTEDVRQKAPIRFKSGIFGSKADNRVASPGPLSLTFNNAEDNSAGLIGYYSPKHTNVRLGWDIGVEVRVGFTHYGTHYYKWTGFVKDIDVHPGFDSYAVDVKAVDWIDYAGRMTLDRLSIRTNEDAGTLFWRLYVTSPRRPVTYLYYKGTDLYPYAFDRGRDEGTLILREIHHLTQSELGFVVLRGNTVGGGQLTFESRGRRALKTVVLWTMSAANIIRDLRLDTYGLDGMANRVLLHLHPRRVDLGVIELFKLQSELMIPAGETIPFVCPYRDPTGKFVRVGGTDMVEPVATTDYTMFTASGGGGADITGDLAVTMTFGGNSALASLKNNNAADGYVNLFKLRGKGLYSDESVIIDKKDQASLDTHGQMLLSIDMSYQADVALGNDLADVLLANYKEPVPRVKSVGFIANKLSDAMMNALVREPGDRISVTEEVSGLAAAEYFIQGLEIVVAEGIITCSWNLMPVELEDGLGT